MALWRNIELLRWRAKRAASAATLKCARIARRKTRVNALMTLALKWARRRALLEAADDVAQRTLTRFRRGRARVATRHFPGGGHAMVVIGNDGNVHRAA